MLFDIVYGLQKNHRLFFITQMYEFYKMVIIRNGNIDYQEVHYIDQMELVMDEIKNRLVFGSSIPNMCQCRQEPMVQINSTSCNSYFEDYDQLNKLYTIWKDL